MSMSMLTAVTVGGSRRFGRGRTQTQCSGFSPRRGFGSKKGNQIKKPTEVSTSREEEMRSQSQLRKSANRKLGTRPSQAPGLSAQVDGKPSISLDSEFEERLEAIRRMAHQQKEEEKKEFGPIDYDAPNKSDEKTLGLGTKAGVGLAVVVFGLVFTLGDFFPSGSDNQSDTVVVDKKLPPEEKAALQSRLQQFEAVLRTSPKDMNALEGVAVISAELGEYAQAVSLLQDLAKVKNNDPEVFRLIGEVKYELKDYDGSAAAYKLSAMVSEDIGFDVLRGLTNALIAAKKPDEAVKFLLAAREQMNKERSDSSNTQDGRKANESESGNMDFVQVDLLLGKAYSDWGHVSDAVAVYDKLISSNPNDFRGYLAKGIILKENGNVGGAERMFIQARFFAPEKAKTLVDRYSRQ